MPLSKVSAELLICSRWHFNSSLQLIFNSSQNIVSANISNKAASSPPRYWPSFSSRTGVWGFGVNICFFLQRQKSCPSGSAAVCKRGGANGCCGTHAGTCEAEGLISPKVLRGVRLLPAIDGPACVAHRSLPHSRFSLLLCHQMHRCRVFSCGCGRAALQISTSTRLRSCCRHSGARVSSDFGECVLNRNGLRSTLCDVFALHSLVPLQSTKQYCPTASFTAAGDSLECFLFIIVCLRVMSGNMRTGEI